MEPTLSTVYKPKLLTDFFLPESVLEVIRVLGELSALNVLIVADGGAGKTSLIEAIIRLHFRDVSSPEEEIMFITTLQDQGISYYRNEVRTFCRTPPSKKGTKKMLVIDNLDTVNDQSQQVFRNCIDKYSHNVQFVSTCSNVQKIIESLQSRVTIIRLPRVTTSQIRTFCEKVCLKEKMTMTDQATDFVATISHNSIRTMINYLEKFKLLNLSTIQLDDVKEACTNISLDALSEYTTLCLKGDLHGAIKILHEAVDDGFSVMDVLDGYFSYVKLTNDLCDDEKYKLVPILCKYMTVFHNIHEDEVELCFFTAEVIHSLENPV